MNSSHNNIFIFDSELAELLKSAKSLEERLSARTTVGSRYLGPKLRTAGLAFLDFNDQLHLSDYPDALVIGIASYSDPDIEVLNDFYDFLRGRPQTFIFDIDRVKSLKALNSVMPTAALFTKTPVLAEYRSGILTTFFQGGPVVNWLGEKSVSNYVS